MRTIYRYVYDSHTKIRMPSPTGSLVIAIIPKIKYKFCTVAMLLLYTLQNLKDHLRPITIIA